MTQAARLAAVLARMPEAPSVERPCLDCGERPVAYRGLRVCRRCYLRRTRATDPAMFRSGVTPTPCRWPGCPRVGRGRSRLCKPHYQRAWHRDYRWRMMLRRMGAASLTLPEALEAVQARRPEGWEAAEAVIRGLAEGRWALMRNPYRRRHLSGNGGGV